MKHILKTSFGEYKIRLLSEMDFWLSDIGMGVIYSMIAQGYKIRIGGILMGYLSGFTVVQLLNKIEVEINE